VASFLYYRPALRSEVPRCVIAISEKLYARTERKLPALPEGSILSYRSNFGPKAFKSIMPMSLYDRAGFVEAQRGAMTRYFQPGSRGLLLVALCLVITGIENVHAYSADKLALGNQHSCALTSSGGVQCWGEGYAAPFAVVGLSRGVLALASGGEHSCAITSGGAVKCWGANASGQLGNGTTAIGYTPVDVVDLPVGVSALALGGEHSCALTPGGAVKCWGSNKYGQLGNGHDGGFSTPVDVVNLSGGISALALGESHSCAVTVAGGVKCWGSNFYGELGDGTETDRSVPVDVVGLSSGVTALALGATHSCALTSGGAVKCWGLNYLGQLGDGTTRASYIPVDVTGLSSGISVLVSGLNHSCVVTSEGVVKCWGSNGSGQLGNGTPGVSNIPVDVTGLLGRVSALSLGGSHSCAVTSDGTVKCWGSNNYGQLGNGAGYLHPGIPVYNTTPVDVLYWSCSLKVNAACKSPRAVRKGAICTFTTTVKDKQSKLGVNRAQVAILKNSRNWSEAKSGVTGQKGTFVTKLKVKKTSYFYAKINEASCVSDYFVVTVK